MTPLQKFKALPETDPLKVNASAIKEIIRARAFVTSEQALEQTKRVSQRKTL